MNNELWFLNRSIIHNTLFIIHKEGMPGFDSKHGRMYAKRAIRYARKNFRKFISVKNTLAKAFTFRIPAFAPVAA
jgi:hypothetical protein